MDDFSENEQIFYDADLISNDLTVATIGPAITFKNKSI